MGVDITFQERKDVPESLTGEHFFSQNEEL
jgi:hypothetical protein